MSLARLFPLALLLAACQGEVGIGSTDTDTDVDTEPDFSMYDGATLRIVEPPSASFLPLGQTHTFVAEVYDAEGELLDESFDVSWDSSADETWAPEGLTFEDDTIDVGIHDLTAQVVLPNGDRLAHTVGGVLVQHEAAGTYVGSFSGGTVVQQIPVSCAGAAVLIVDPYGEQVDGTADCLIRLDQFELPLDFTIEAENDGGAVEGDAIATIFSFDVDFPATGGIEGERLDLEFSGSLLTNTFDGTIRTERISRDTGN